MFGMGFTEIILITVIAILFIGPEKLPQALIDVAKFFKQAKDAVISAKASLEEEIDIVKLKEEALSYKRDLESASSELGKIASGEIDTFSTTTSSQKSESEKSKQEKITFKKKSKKESRKRDEIDA